MRSRGLELACLLAAAAAPFLPPPAAAAILVAAGAAFLTFRPAPREAAIVLAGLGLAAILLVGPWALGLGPELDGERWAKLAQPRYDALWNGLAAAGSDGAAGLGRPPQIDAERLAAFGLLSNRALGSSPETTFLLFNPDGEAVAWGGEGLLHEALPDSLPASGPAFVAGFSSSTLLEIQPIAGGKRAWRLAAGRSLRTDQLPFADPDWRHRRPWRWSLIADSETPASDCRVVASTLPGVPRLVAEPAGEIVAILPGARRWAWALVGLALVALAVLRGIGVAFLSGTVVRGRTRSRHVVALAAGGVTCWLLAGGAEPSGLVPLATAGLLAAVVLQWRRPLPPWAAVVGGAVAGSLLLGAALVVQRLGFDHDLGSAVFGTASAVALRLGMAALALALLLAAAGRAPRDEQVHSLYAWLSTAAMLVSAAFIDRYWLSIPALIVGCALAARWAAGNWPFYRLASAASAVLLAALAGAGAWELAHRITLRADVPRLLTALASPTAAEDSALAGQVRAALASADVEELSPGDPDRLDPQDLAIALWRRSPLARGNTWSALSVVPYRGAGSRFAFGLPLRGEDRVERPPGRWAPPLLPVWDEGVIAGEAELRAGSHPFGRALFWVQPRPGFRWGEARAGDLGRDLLRGAPGAHTVEGLPSGVQFAIYDATGHALLSPWPEAPPLDPRVRRGLTHEVETPFGRAAAWAEAGPEGTRVLYVPTLEPLQGLDRLGTHALSTLLLVSSAGLLVLLLGLPRAAFRDTLRRAVRSYSKRLLIVYTVLLLLPLLLLSFALVRGLEERVRREQRTDGEQALASAQRVLGEYLLTLDPGFGLDTALDDDLLSWLSGVVHHEVNLYWGSSVYASSKRELFTAGLLPKRIPGEIYSRLTLGGYDVASKTGHTGDVSYLEIYAPLRMPGARETTEGLALSMPLLAQQEEMQVATAYLRRQALLGTAALFVLLVAVGGRLARNFTQPLQELVRGTQRIAAGAASTGLAPSELELVALVEAVDRMAQRIAEARGELLRGKHVLESMVENVTAGVVSLDREQRVVLHNRAAADLLGVSRGESLRAALARRPDLLAVGEWLRGVGGSLARTTVRLPSEKGEQEWALVWVPLPRPGEPAALLVVEDATEILRGQRLEAWAEMARMIAHEIKNPLTPIRLSTEHMREVRASAPDRFEEVFERCTLNILHQVEDLRQIASEFSTYSRIPKLELRQGDLVSAVHAVVDGYRTAPPAGVSFRFEAPEVSFPARFDERLLARAVRNLLENAVRACGGGGEVVVGVARLAGSAQITVADSGPGVPSDQLPRIFDPYFSTHATGTGLGLPISQRIVEEHGGVIVARNRAGGGLEVAITIPCP